MSKIKVQFTDLAYFTVENCNIFRSAKIAWKNRLKILKDAKN